MLKKIFFITFSGMFFYSCGKKSTESGSSSTTSCAATRSSPVSTNEKNFQDMLSMPFIASRYSSSSNFEGNFKIIGGDTIPTTTNCRAGSRATGTSASYTTVTTKNTVAIRITSPTNSSSVSLCSGTLVTTDLVLTAAHCFDAFTTNGSNPSNIVVVFASNANSTSQTATALSWYRNPSHSTSGSTTAASILNDIAWIKVSEATVTSYGYTPVNVLASPQTTLSATEEKLFVGYGATYSTTTSDATGQGPQGCVSTYADANYITRGDVVPSGAVSSFNSSTSANSYENYLTVIGPINGSNPRGTCFGDSGGPAYVYRSGSWVLAALTEGSNNLLSPKPTIDFTQCSTSTNLNTKFNTSAAASCQDGYGDYTTVANYSSWISSSTLSQTGTAETITTQ